MFVRGYARGLSGGTREVYQGICERFVRGYAESWLKLRSSGPYNNIATFCGPRRRKRIYVILSN